MKIVRNAQDARGRGMMSRGETWVSRTRQPIAKRKAGAGFVETAGGICPGALCPEPVRVREIRCARDTAAVGCDVATPGVDFGAVPGTGRCDLSNLVAGEIVEVVHARAAGGLADALTVGIVDSKWWAWPGSNWRALVEVAR